MTKIDIFSGFLGAGKTTLIRKMLKEVFAGEKTRTQVAGTFCKMEGIWREMEGASMKGYEIHMGVTECTRETSRIVRIEEETGNGKLKYDGAQNGNCLGCYIHGIFEEQTAALAFAKVLLKQKGYDPEKVKAVDWTAHKEEQYNKLADISREKMDMDMIYRILGKGQQL